MENNSRHVTIDPAWALAGFLAGVLWSRGTARTAATDPIPPRVPKDVAQPSQRRPSAEYNWGWFSYHAGQRLKTFNFFLITIGVIILAYIQALDKFTQTDTSPIAWRAVGAAIGAFGTLVSLAFYMLEIRNLELVNYGRNALNALEADLGIGQLRQNDHDRTELNEAITTPRIVRMGLIGFILMLLPWSERKTLTTHTWWLRRMLRLSMSFFTAAAVYAGLGFPGISRLAPP